jgi:hypothetical protein
MLYTLAEHPKFKNLPIGNKGKTWVKRRHVGNAFADFAEMLKKAIMALEDSLGIVLDWANIGVPVSTAGEIIRIAIDQEKKIRNIESAFDGSAEKSLLDLYVIFQEGLLVEKSTEATSMQRAQWGFEQFKKAAAKQQLIK